MKKVYTPISLLTSMLLIALVVSCSKGNNQYSSSNSSYSSEDSIAESSNENKEYDENWTPGPNAIANATQPSVKNPQGIITELGKVKASQNKAGLPQKGQSNLLVVPLSFKSDSDYGCAYSNERIDTLNDTYFGNDTTSVSKFYDASSYGLNNLSGVVTPTVTMPNNLLSYLDRALNYGAVEVVKEITDYVYEYLFETTETYYNQDFDSDDDGKIDGIVLAYSWYPYEAYYTSELFEYLAYFLFNETFFGSELNASSPINSISWTSGTISEVTNVTNDSHVAINLVGKMMGIEDYQDLTGDSEGNFRSPLAHLDTMDGYIGDHNPFTKYQLGWIEPTKIAADNFTSNSTYTLKPYEEAGDTLLLSPEQTGLFDEYLLVEYYTPTGLYKNDSSRYYDYNFYRTVCYQQAGIRVYKVDARLVEGTSATDVEMFYGNPDFDKTVSLPNGSKTKAYYDYAFTNSSINKYSNQGIYEDYPLVTELSKKGFNRHMVDSTFKLKNDDLFLEGDCFGNVNDIDGFYINYTFNGNGSGDYKLNLTFSVDSITNSEATITVRRAN